MEWLIDDKGRKYFLDKKGHEGKIFMPKIEWFKEWADGQEWRNKYPWYCRVPFFHLIVQWLITFSVIYPTVFGNNGKFKVGDKVKYNWKAKIQINKSVEKMNRIRIVSEVLYSDKSGLDFTNGDSCASFWVRKLYFWEK